MDQLNVVVTQSRSQFQSASQIEPGTAPDDFDGGLKTTTSFTLNVSIITNRAPTISSIGNQSVVDGQAVGSLSFAVSDTETAASSLTVTAASSNATVLPASGIVLGGSGGARTIALNPVLGQLGSTTVTLTVTDGGGVASTTSFILTVTNAAPTISSVADRVVAPGSPVSNVQFTLSDLETAPGSLSVSIASSNTNLFQLPGSPFEDPGRVEQSVWFRTVLRSDPPQLPLQ